MKEQIDQRIYDLYDEYCHSGMSRREFLNRASMITVVGTITGLQMAKLLLPDYVQAQEISFTDERMKAQYISYDSPGGVSGKMKGYLVKPEGEGPFPSVIVIHENRGLNPYVEDVARRLAVAGFLALAPDVLSVVGGYPGNDEDGKILQANLDREKVLIDLKNSALFLREYKLSNKKLGAVGFCFGGAVTNYLAVELKEKLLAAVPFYGTSPEPNKVSNIQAAMLIQYAENDERVNKTQKEFEEALKKEKKNFQMFTYPKTQHGFHNYSTPRYDKDAAKLAWDRTIAHFNKYLKS